MANISEIIELLDQEIERLMRARQILNISKTHSPQSRTRRVSAEARKRISDGQKRRWAPRKQQAKKK